MTCIIGIVNDEKIYMGADSLGSAGCHCVTRKDVKVFKKNDFIFGYTSSYRMGQLIRFNFTPPKIHEEQDVFEYMVVEFIPELRTCLKNGGFTKINNNEETGGAFLVGFKKRLFMIDNDFQVGEAMANYDSVGCGYEIALGSLFSTTGKPKNRILTALCAAEEFSNGVRKPFIVEEL